MTQRRPFGNREVRFMNPEAARACAHFVARIPDTQGKRKVPSAVLLNADLDHCDIVSYQLKHPFECLQRDPKGAFRIQWWAIEDLNL